MNLRISNTLVNHNTGEYRFAISDGEFNPNASAASNSIIDFAFTPEQCIILLSNIDKIEAILRQIRDATHTCQCGKEFADEYSNYHYSCGGGFMCAPNLRKIEYAWRKNNIMLCGFPSYTIAILVSPCDPDLRLRFGKSKLNGGHAQEKATVLLHYFAEFRSWLQRIETKYISNKPKARKRIMLQRAKKNDVW